jgi:hypothetical protein
MFAAHSGRAVSAERRAGRAVLAHIARSYEGQSVEPCSFSSRLGSGSFITSDRMRIRTGCGSRQARSPPRFSGCWSPSSSRSTWSHGTDDRRYVALDDGDESRHSRDTPSALHELGADGGPRSPSVHDSVVRRDRSARRPCHRRSNQDDRCRRRAKRVWSDARRTGLLRRAAIGGVTVAIAAAHQTSLRSRGTMLRANSL